MRLSNFVFVAAAALLASCDAVSATTDSTPAKLLAMTSPDAAQSVDAAHGDKRFLRTTKYDDVDDDDDDLDSSDDDDNDSKEERMQRLPSFNGKWDKKLLNDIAHVPGADKKIRRWNADERTPQEVKGLLGITNLDKNDPDVRTYLLFLAAYMRTHNIVH